MEHTLVDEHNKKGCLIERFGSICEFKWEDNILRLTTTCILEGHLGYVGLNSLNSMGASFSIFVKDYGISNPYK